MKPRPTDTPQESPAESPGESVSEQVGKIIDESRDDSARGEGMIEDAVDGEQVENPPNPKKRMWEEDKEAVKEAERNRDEL